MKTETEAVSERTSYFALWRKLCGKAKVDGKEKPSMNPVFGIPLDLTERRLPQGSCWVASHCSFLRITFPYDRSLLLLADADGVTFYRPLVQPNGDVWWDDANPLVLDGQNLVNAVKAADQEKRRE